MSLKLKLDQIKELKEGNIDDANRLLKENYVLLKMVKITEKDEEKMLYVLGK